MKARLLFSGMLLALAIPFSVAAQDGSSSPSLERGQGVDYLTDGDGRSVYIYLRDGQGESSCYDVCAENWPPVVVNGEPAAGDGVIESMISTVERTDGTTQLAYNGWPLYYHERDTAPGEADGHRLGEIFYLISSSGSRVEGAVEDQIAAALNGETVTDEAAAPAEDTGEDTQTADAGPGADLFAANCAVCHGAAGEGVVGPGLAGNPAMQRAEYIITTVLFGREDHGMPPFADRLSDEEIAAIATFVRGSWGNDYPAVNPADVAAHR